jgi:hypothetical protein
LRAARDTLRERVAAWPARTVEHPAFVPLVAFGASVAFAVAYNIRLGHFAATKAVYYFPCMAAYLYFFAAGREALAEKKTLQRTLDAVIVLLLVLDVFEIGSVIVRLDAVKQAL